MPSENNPSGGINSQGNQQQSGEPHETSLYFDPEIDEY